MVVELVLQTVCSLSLLDDHGIHVIMIVECQRDDRMAFMCIYLCLDVHKS